jgi:hypothetical protein
VPFAKLHQQLSLLAVLASRLQIPSQILLKHPRPLITSQTLSVNNGISRVNVILANEHVLRVS